MPELPEVEAARRAIEEHCAGKKITRVLIADDSKVIDGVSPAEFEASLLGKTIVSAHRKGKNLWLRLDSPPFPSFQFGMAGAVYIKGVAVTKYKRSAVKDTDEWPSKYSKFFVELDDGLEFSFTDKRRFARVRLLKDPTSVPPISDLGPDALLEPMTVDELMESLSKKKIAIKTLLLDQSIISGIGNWVADEVLYQARIHPEQSASSLSKECCESLHNSIKEVIEFAVQVDADSIQFPRKWLFHFRWGKKAGNVNGKQLIICYRSLKNHLKLEQIVVSFLRTGFFITVKRSLEKLLLMTTAYVPELQKLNGQQAKAGSKQSNKRKGRGEDANDDNDEAESDEEANGSAKSKKGRKPRGQGRSSSAKRKSKESDDEDNDGDDEDIDDDADDSDDHHDEDPKKKSKKATNNKQSKAAKTSKKKVQNNQNSRQKK